MDSKRGFVASCTALTISLPARLPTLSWGDRTYDEDIAQVPKEVLVRSVRSVRKVPVFQGFTDGATSDIQLVDEPFLRKALFAGRLSRQLRHVTMK